jgi:SAM-dependent methyltransferase
MAVSRFGVMFFTDPVAAFANVRRSLRPGGRLVFLCLQEWGRNEIGAVLGAVARHLTPSDSGSDSTSLAGAFSLADPALIHRLLDQAGFSQIRTTEVEAVQVWGRDAADATQFLAGWGPVRHLFDHAAEPESARMALQSALAERESSDGVRLQGAGWLVCATRAAGA